MSASPIEPSTAEELAAAVQSAPRVLVVGAATKPRLSEVEEATRISTRRLKGILEYDPSEFTFTALAGTPVREIVSTLAERGQYLPFDPPFAAEGATIGGTVAAGLSGAGRFRYGGLRDFILGVRFVDGEGRLLRLGGKVVKNAAGFDLPKFFVGSLGRFGALAELTFKVFPQPPATQTLKLTFPSVEGLAKCLAEAGSTRWELGALEASVTEKIVYAKLGGPAAALDSLAKEILHRWPGERLNSEAADAIWADLAAFRWAQGPENSLLKVPLTPALLPALADALHAVTDAKIWASAGGAVAYIALSSASPILVVKDKLQKLNLGALVLRGRGPLWAGARPDFNIHRAVKAALDPQNRFPSLDDD